MKDLVKILNFICGMASMVLIVAGVVWYVFTAFKSGFAFYPSQFALLCVGIGAKLVEVVTGVLMKKWGIEDLNSGLNANMMGTLNDMLNENVDKEVDGE